MLSQYRQITAKRSVGAGNFSNGVIDFDFSIGGSTGWSPSRTYFRIAMKLTKADGITAPVVADNVTFANFAAGNLFDNVILTAGGQEVSAIYNYSPQAHACRYRLKKSGAWLNSVGKDAYGINSSFTSRLQRTSSDGLPGNPSQNPPSDDPDASSVFMMYSPPIGIQEHTGLLGSGEYRYQFSPNSNYKKACVESFGVALEPGYNYQFEIDRIELYVYTEKVDIPATGTDKLFLMEHQVQTKPLLAGQDQNLDFTIPVSTKAISVFVQSRTAGNDTRVPPSNFKCLTTAVLGTANPERTLKSLQLSYANITKPPTRFDSEYNINTGVMKLQQRYLDTQIQSAQAFSSGGAENLQSWLENGPIYHYAWARDQNDRSTQLQIQIDFRDIEESNLIVVAHYSKTVEVQVTNGFISSVSSLVI